MKYQLDMYVLDLSYHLSIFWSLSFTERNSITFMSRSALSTVHHQMQCCSLNKFYIDDGALVDGTTWMNLQSLTNLLHIDFYFEKKEIDKFFEKEKKKKMKKKENKKTKRKRNIYIFQIYPTQHWRIFTWMHR